MLIVHFFHLFISICIVITISEQGIGTSLQSWKATVFDLYDLIVSGKSNSKQIMTIQRNIDLMRVHTKCSEYLIEGVPKSALRDREGIMSS